MNSVEKLDLECDNEWTAQVLDGRQSSHLAAVSFEGSIILFGGGTGG